MCALALNPVPIMTRYLVQDCQAFTNDPIVIFDVGARFGANAEWAVFGDQMRIFCFEPDEDECRRLTAEAPPEVVYIPTALARTRGQATLYESKLAASTSLYRTRMDYFGRFVNRDNGIVVAEHAVSVKSLDEAMAEHRIPRVDFIKLDAEGAELDILQGGEKALSGGRPLGFLSEIRLHDEINGSPPFASLDAFARQQGFRLFNIDVNHHGRRALPYPQLSDYRLPSGERFYAYTQHGQVQDGDALYFRDLAVAREVPPLDVLKLSALMEIYHLSDCAGELILTNKERLRTVTDPDRLLDLLVEGMTGQPGSYHEYIEAYFASPPPPPPPVSAEVSPVPDVQQNGTLKRLLRRLGLA